MGAEGFVEVFDRGQRTNGPGVATELTEIDIVFFVVFIFDFTDDQFKNVLNGHQTRDTAELVDNDSHMVPLRAELFQHAVNTLALRYDNRRA
ncbi:hypothetical protein D3C73_1513210 [compost metagenome]